MQSSYLYKVDLLWRIYNGAKSFRENTFQKYDPIYSACIFGRKQTQFVPCVSFLLNVQ